VIKLFLSGGI